MKAASRSIKQRKRGQSLPGPRQFSDGAVESRSPAHVPTVRGPEHPLLWPAAASRPPPSPPSGGSCSSIQHPDGAAADGPSPSRWHVGGLVRAMSEEAGLIERGRFGTSSQVRSFSHPKAAVSRTSSSPAKPPAWPPAQPSDLQPGSSGTRPGRFWKTKRTPQIKGAELLLKAAGGRPIHHQKPGPSRSAAANGCTVALARPHRAAARVCFTGHPATPRAA